MTQRHLELGGLHNLRDLGGYTSSSSSRRARTGWGLIYRGDSPHRLTPGARAELERRGVTTVIDLRHAGELEAAPNPLADLAGYRHVPLLAALQSDPSALTSLEALYVATLDHCGSALREVIEAVVAAPGATLVHCTAGKDRTGVVAALLLGAVGVDDAAIGEDYALTEVRAVALLAELLEQARASGRDPDGYARFLTARPETMLATLRHLRERYGGVRSYLGGVGVEPDQLAALERRWLEGG